jgi:Periplasmic binding protein
MIRAAAIALALLTACTSTQPEPSAGPTPAPTSTPITQPAGLEVPVIAPGAERSLLDGLALGAAGTDLGLDIRDRGRPTALLRAALGDRPPAILVVASTPAVVDAVTEVRPDIEAARVPVIVLGADLYSARALHRYVFQTAVPATWQARVLAHYLVADRNHDRVISWDPIAGAALQEEGVQPVAPGGPADAALAVARIPSAEGSAGQLALSSVALTVTSALPPGTVACAPYTWAGWAAMIPRVARFRERFTARFEHPPVGFEQEGYDAVRAVAEALDRTGGGGGDALVRQLETYRDETFSSTPIRLGPDDHVFAEQSHLGLFAVAGPGEEPSPPEAMGALPWRPLMRTFTTNGKRVNLADRDVRVFFPNWGPRRPRPNYWRSEYGIVTRPDDPLH